MWYVLQHAEWEGPGIIAEALAAHAIRFEIVRLDRGAAVPKASNLDGLVVMGGPMGVYEAADYPFLAAEQKLIASCVAGGRAVLGVCLGAQLLAAALGAPVIKGPQMEAGEGSVVLTGSGRQDPVLGGGKGELPVVHWHQDTFPLPQEATLLACSRLYEQQAFRLARTVYGLQFHLELSREQADDWRNRGLTITREYEQRVRAVGERVFDNFIHLAVAGG
ncbi:MAG: type 1 glutamine amidotransferase [Acidobacteria bacterium]|nr:MAG: type 1 glutamine amidotransferase [Acidobacteriota bacterium]